MYSVSHSRHLLLSTCLEIQKFAIRQKQFQDSLDYEMANQRKLTEQELFENVLFNTLYISIIFSNENFKYIWYSLKPMSMELQSHA